MNIRILAVLLMLACCLPAIAQINPRGLTTYWRCAEDRDRMDDRVSHVLSMESIAVNLSPPWRQGSMVISHHSRWPGSLSIYLTEGLFDCRRDSRNCFARVRFDEQPAIRVSIRVGSDADFATIEGTKLLQSLRTAQAMLFEVPIFRNGSQIYEFYPTGESRCPRPPSEPPSTGSAASGAQQ